MVYFLIPIGIHLLFSYRLLFVDPPVWPDESYFITVAESLLSTGKLSMPLYRTEAIGSPEIRMYSYPPLYFYILALWIQLFGSSLVSLRFLSVCASILTVYLFYRLIHRMTQNSRFSMAGTLALVFFGPFGMASRVGRMDIFVFLGIILTLYARSSIISGLTAGLTILFHPLGILALVAGLLHTKRKQFFVFLLPTLLCIGFWLIIVSDRFDLFLTQMQLQLVYKTGREAILTLLFQNDMFWRIVILFYLALGSFGIITGIHKKQSFSLIAGLGTYLTIILLIYAVDQWYLVFLPVFPIILTVLRKNLLLILIVVMLHGYSFLSGFITHLNRNEQYEEFARGISKEIPPGKIVVLSSIPDLYFALRTRDDLTIYQVPHVTERGKLEQLLDDADVLIYNYATNKDLEPYLKTRTEKTITVVQENGYQADVVFFAR
jgi:4-amino-4-deoxy-L-arabinose transferase-like glycosyltransferase